MTAGVIAIAYAVPTLIAWRAIFRASIADARSVYLGIDWDDIALGMLTASLGCWFWPILLPAYLISEHGDPSTFARRVGGEIRKEKVARLEREREEQRRKINRLERELGVERRGGTTS